VELAERSATSQAALSAYERGRKIPNAATLERILAAAGFRLRLQAASPVVTRNERDHRRAARALRDVLALAEALPSTPSPELRFPRLPMGGDAAA